MQAPDWIQAGLLVIAIGGLIWTVLALKEQTRARDFENYLSLKERFASAWRALAKAEEDDELFEFTELMNLLESVCHLYNKRVVRGTTRHMVCEYLTEILAGVFDDERAKARILHSLSAPDTYSQIRCFARKQRIPRVLQLFDCRSSARPPVDRVASTASGASARDDQ